MNNLPLTLPIRLRRREGKRNDSRFYVIAHNIRSLYNVGSLFRTADAFGVDKLILTGYTGTPKNPRLAKTALGAEKTVAWEYHRQLKTVITKLKQEKFTLVALENNVPPLLDPLPQGERKRKAENNIRPPLAPPYKGGELSHFKPKFPLALLLGEEVGGIKRNNLKLCDTIVEIPMQGQKESLNVSVAAGIAMYYITMFRK